MQFKDKYNFKNLLEFVSFFNSNEKCREYLSYSRWNGKPQCPRCNYNEKMYFLKTKNIYKCPKCYKQFSVTQGTIFHGSNVPLTKWFFAMYEFTNNVRGISSVQLAKRIGVEQKTAWLMLQKIRKSLSQDEELLTGIVEVDEAYCGPKINRDKRLAAKVYKHKEMRIKMEAEGVQEKRRRKKRDQKDRENLWDIYSKLQYECRSLLSDKEDRMRWYQPFHYKKNIVGAIERNIKDSFGNVIKKGKLRLTKMGRHGGDICEENMIPYLTKTISPDSHLITDKAMVYYNMNTYFREHSTITHSTKGTPSKNVRYVNGYKTTNSIENIWNQFKKMENTTFVHFSWKYTNYYLNEFVFRYNYGRGSSSEIFHSLLKKTVNILITRKDVFLTPDDYTYQAK